MIVSSKSAGLNAEDAKVHAEVAKGIRKKKSDWPEVFHSAFLCENLCVLCGKNRRMAGRCCHASRWQVLRRDCQRDAWHHVLAPPCFAVHFVDTRDFESAVARMEKRWLISRRWMRLCVCHLSKLHEALGRKVADRFFEKEIYLLRYDEEPVPPRRFVD